MKQAAVRLCCVFLFLCPALVAQSLPAGTILEVRLLQATGSRISHCGEQVEAMLISRVLLDGRIAIPQGTLLRGTVENVIRLGLGLRHKTAEIAYRFTDLQLPDGMLLPMHAQPVDVDTAKERVDSRGVVRGTHPLATLSSVANFYILPMLWIDPGVGIPLLAAKTLVAPSSSSEIYYPEGTELTLKLDSELDVSLLPEEPLRLASLSDRDQSDIHPILDAISPLRARAGKRPSDFVNVAVMGRRGAIAAAFRAAGWVKADSKSPMALFHIYSAITRRVGYPREPMAPLTLEGKRSELAFQKSLNTIAKRHHARFWMASPAGNVWLGAATEDTAVRFTGLLWTHSTDPVTATERSKVLDDLAFTGCVASAGLVSSPLAAGRAVEVIRLSDCAQPREMPGVNRQAPSHPPHWLSRTAASFRNDFLQFNPVFTGVNTVRSLMATRRVVPPAASTASVLRQPDTFVPCAEVRDGGLQPAQDFSPAASFFPKRSVSPFGRGFAASFCATAERFQRPISWR